MEEQEDETPVLENIRGKVNRLWYCPGMPGALEAQQSFSAAQAQQQ